MHCAIYLTKQLCYAMVKVLVTNKECENEPKTTCTEAVTVLFQDHVINLRRSEAAESVIVSIDGELIDKFPHYSPWARLEKLPGEEVTLLLSAIQVPHSI